MRLRLDLSFWQYEVPAHRLKVRIFFQIEVTQRTPFAAAPNWLVRSGEGCLLLPEPRRPRRPARLYCTTQHHHTI